MGAKADLVFLDLRAINWIPHNRTVNQLVHAEDATSVRHVMIGGRLVVHDRMLTTVDLARLAREAEAARERLEAANADLKALADNLSVVVGSFCPGLAAAALPGAALRPRMMPRPDQLQGQALWRRPKISEPALNSVIPAKAGTQVA